jgi:hypothetical protein
LAWNSGLYFGKSVCTGGNGAGGAPPGAGPQPIRQIDPSALLHRPHELDAAQVIPRAVEINAAVGELRRRFAESFCSC